jgi:hypothetical protein
METKHPLNRKKIAAARKAVFLMGFAACVFAADAADRSLELRQRLDSIEVETQVRKRQGRPIEDLEAVSAGLRDTLVGLRGKAPQAAPPREDREEQRFPYLDKIPYIEEILAFRPSGAFDWVIVGTGAVALLSGLTLIIGLFAGRKKKRAAVPRKQQGSRKINLAPTSTQRAVPEVNNNNEPPPRDSVVEFQSLVENLRKVAPPPLKAPSPFTSSDYEPRTYAPPPTVKEPEPRRPAPPPPPEEPAAPAPLIVNAPETPSSPPPATLSGKPLASEVLSARTPPMPPPSVPVAAGSPPKPPSAGTAGFPAFSTLVIAAAKDGVDDMEISRRYQLSVDQVKLILRMERNKHP